MKRQTTISPRTWFDTKHSLQRTLFWSFALVILLPIVLVGGVVAYSGFSAARQDARDKLVTAALLKEKAVDLWLDGITDQFSNPLLQNIGVRMLQNTKTHPEMIEHNRLRFKLDTLQLLGSVKNIEHIFLLDNDGIVVATTNDDVTQNVGDDFSHRHFYILGLDNPHFGGLLFDEKTGKAGLYIAEPLYDSNNQRIGMLVGQVNTDPLVKILTDKNEMGEESETYVALQGTQLLSEKLTLLAPSMYDAGIKGYKETFDIRFYDNYDDTPVIGAERFIDRIGAAIIVEQSQKAAFQSIINTAYRALLITLLILAGVAVLGYMLTKRIITPLEALTTAATDIAGGNLDRRIEIQREDEIGTLAKAFGNMTARLRELISTLEDRVHQRTQALAHRGTQLRTAIEVSKTASTTLETAALLQQSVDLIKEQFGYYYVGLFLVDEAYQWAVLKSGTGEAGKRQLADNHRLKIDETSMVGWSIVHRQPRISGQVAAESVRFENPYLPETRSEMALPLISRSQVLGALTIQSVEENAFSQEDIDVLQTVADQIANALQNSRLFGQVQAIQARFQDLYHRAPVGYHTLALDGTIKEINDTELEMLGYTGLREQILNKRRITEFMTEESRTTFEEVLEDFRVGRRQQLENIELTYVRKDGSTLPVATTVTLGAPDELGGVREIYATAQDISRQKSVEAARESLLQEATIMYNLGQQYLLALSTTEIFDATFDAVETMNPTWGTMVMLYHSDATPPYVELAAMRLQPEVAAKSPLTAGATFPMGNYGFSEMRGGRQTIISTDGTADPQFQPALQQLIGSLGFRGMVTVPVWSGDENSGFLLVANLETETFPPEKIRLLESIGQQLSIALNDQLHFEQAFRRATQLQAAAEIAKTTTAQTDLASLLPTVATLLQQHFEYYAVSIFLIDDYRQYAVLEAIAAEALPAEQRDDFLRYKLPINSRSQVSVAIARKTVQNAADISQDAAYQEHPLLPETKSEITIPLISRGEVIGALDVQSVHKNDFSADDELILRAIADQVANAISVIRLLESERANAQEIQALHRRYLEDSWQIYLQSHDNTDRDMYLIPPNGEKFSTDWLLTEGKNGDTRIVSPAETGEKADVSALVSPLTLRGATIGALALIDSAEREWTEDERAILQAVSAQAALAVDNARLIEQTERWVAELQTSAEIGQAITATLDLNQLLAYSVSLVQSRFGLKQVNIYLTDPASNNWDALVFSGSGQSTEAKTDRRTLQYGSLPWRAVHQRQTIVAQQAQPDSVALLPEDDPDVKSALVIPLVLGQETIGAIEMRSPQQNAFDQNLIAVMEILATQIATSIGNAKAYQEERDIAEQLREVDKLKTQFLANMSHELRTPLNSIIGFSRVILKGIDGPLTEMQRTDLSSIHQSGKHLLDLINNILDLSKIEAGKMDMNISPLNLKPLLDGAASTAVGLVKDKSVDVRTEIPEDLPPVMGDETRMRQVLLNLVSNAAKFTEEGSITITAGTDDEQVWVSVADTGIGIAPENQAGIFDEFTQVDASTTRKAGGTGLGLPITKKFMEMHNGTITVNSELGRGSTFTITLPRAPELAEEEGETQEEIVVLPAQTAVLPHSVLVIDGDERVASYYQQYLEGKDVLLTVHTTGENAVEVVKAQQPEAILLDILLPDVSGWQVLEALKQNPHTAHIPVVICSIIEDRFRATQLGAADYLVKPVIKPDLLSVLESVGQLRGSVKKVLVVDDHADDILLIRRILEARDCLVISAANGEEGLAVIHRNRPDLVVLDLTMPKIDGFAVLEMLATDAEFAELPVIVITARELSEEERSQVANRAVAVLSKGHFTDADLLQYVDTYLS